MTDNDRLLSPEDLAAFLDVPIKTLYLCRYRGEGPVGYRIGRHTRYRWSDVGQWIGARVPAAGVRHSRRAPALAHTSAWDRAPRGDDAPVADEGQAATRLERCHRALPVHRPDSDTGAKGFIRATVRAAVAASQLRLDGPPDRYGREYLEGAKEG